MRIKYHLAACDDCQWFAAYDEAPENRPTLREDIASHLRLDMTRHHLATADTELGFSWNECECCGSMDGGDRHSLVCLSVD